MNQKMILKTGKASLALLSASLLAACSMSASSDNPSLSIDLSGLNAQQQYLIRNGLPFMNLVEPGVPPTNVATFECYGVNVTGPGIVDTSKNPERDANFQAKYEQTLAGQSSCSYRGIITRPLTLAMGADVNLQIPPGSLRLVQIVGVNDTAICASGVLGDEDYNDHIPRYFEVGRAILKDVFSDRSVSIATNWPTTEPLRIARKLDCGDGSTNPGPTMVGIAISPLSAQTLAVGGTKQLVVTATYADASTQDISGIVTWSASVAGKVTISSAGLVTGVASGTTQVSAVYTPVGGTQLSASSVYFTINP